MSTGCPPTFALERYLAGELEGSQSESWAAHIGGCERCREKLAGMRQTGSGYMASPGAASLRERLAQPVPVRPPLRWSWPRLFALAVPPLAVAALALFFAGGPDLIAKGKPSISVAVSVAGGPAAPWSGGPLAPGATLQPLWTSATAGFLAVYLHDARAGEVTAVHPRDGDVAAAEPAGTARPIGPSFTLDGGGEGLALWAFFSERPFSRAPLANAVRAGARPEGFDGEVLQLALAPGP